MRVLLRRFYVVLVVLFVTGCSGGGCSSCAGGAIAPIRGGYPLTPERRIPHAMQIRLTQQGLRSVGALAPDLLRGFVGGGIPVPSSSQDITVGRVRICPSGMCRINVTLPTAPPPLELAFAAPDSIDVRIRIVVQGDIPIQACTGACDANCRGTIPIIGGCVTLASPTLTVNTMRGTHGFLGMSTRVTIRRDTHPERLSYFRADLVSPTGTGDAIQETPGEGIEDADVTCSASWICGIINLLRGTIVDQVRGQLSGALGPVQDALAATAMPDPPGCPTGTRAMGSRCVYADMSNVPMLLGTDGQGNLGALLASLTPGLRAFNSYVIAAGDPNHNSEVANMGMTLNVLGAVTSSQHNACVPTLPEPQAPMIPEWMALRQNVVPGTTTGIDLGIGVAEEFLNHSMWHLWNSGMFCLGINTRMSQQVSAGLFTALVSSLRNVIFPYRNSAVGLTLRPQRPPTIRIGRGANLTTDPLMLVGFQNLAIDFYAFSEERYVRFMTVNTDLELPVNLVTDTMGLRPALGMARTANTTVTNSQLVREMPAQLANVLGAILGSALGMFSGALPAIALPAIPVPGPGGMPVGSININVPSMGVQGTTEGSSRFLGIFANLQYRRAGMMQTIEIDTRAEMERIPFDARVYDFPADFSVDQLPRVRLRLATGETFGRDIEYSYRVDDLTWSQWTRDTTVEVSSPSFIGQGRHFIDVRARVVDEPDTVDREPVRVTFDIDVVAPEATVGRRANQLVIDAHDNVDGDEQLQMQVTFDGLGSGSWARTPSIEIPSGARTYAIRVRDTSGNEHTIEGRVDALIIRGGPSTDASSGCGCTAPGARRVDTRALAGLVAAMGAMLVATRRRRRRSVGAAFATVTTPRFVVHGRRRGRAVRVSSWLAALPLCLGVAGCSCGANNMMMMDSGTVGSCDGMTGRVCRMTNRCVAQPACVCPAGQSASGMPSFSEMSCQWDTSATGSCACMPLPPLPQGMAGSHMDMQVHTDNTIWVSAYSAGDPGLQRLYGDLVVGRYDMAMSRVSWTHVDGVPTGVEPTGDPTGWRGGIGEAGDDVGRWNSMRLNAAGNPRVAYWDATHDDLRFAAFDGMRWTTHTVDANGNAGRYASMVLLPGDIPAIAYRATMADPMMAGRIRTVIRLARANNATPAAPTDWMISEVAGAATRCRAGDCPAGQACLASGACAATTSGCMMCSATQACVAGSCQDAMTSAFVEDYPPGFLFASLALDNMQRPALVFYNRDRGNLMGVRATGATTWSAPFVIDGEGAMMRDTGDRGLWASLAVDSTGLWHVAYVDAWEEQVMYVRVRDGATMGMPEVVDTGLGLGTMPFDDGHHVVGDSLSIAVDMAGAARIAYQDSTAGTLRLATRGAMTWTTSVLDMMAHTGYWARLRGNRVGTFWRDLQMRRYGVRVLQVP